MCMCQLLQHITAPWTATLCGLVNLFWLFWKGQYASIFKKSPSVGSSPLCRTLMRTLRKSPCKTASWKGCLWKLPFCYRSFQQKWMGEFLLWKSGFPDDSGVILWLHTGFHPKVIHYMTSSLYYHTLEGLPRNFHLTSLILLRLNGQIPKIP